MYMEHTGKLLRSHKKCPVLKIIPLSFCAALVRVHGCACAEVTLLATRPGLRRLGLGRRLLHCVEAMLLTAGRSRI